MEDRIPVGVSKTLALNDVGCDRIAIFGYFRKNCLCDVKYRINEYRYVTIFDSKEKGNNRTTSTLSRVVQSVNLTRVGAYEAEQGKEKER